MKNKTKYIIAAVLSLIVAAFGWYIAYSDGNPATVPNTEAVIEAGLDVVDEIRKEDTEAVIEEIKPLEGAGDASDTRS